MSENMKGGCACGAIRYEVREQAKIVLNCHCEGCRTRNGTSFSTYCTVSKESLTVLQGKEKLGIYGIDEIGKKHFCSRCGTPLYNFNPRYPEMLMVYYGTVSDHTELTPRFNIYCESQLAWTNEVAKLKSFEQALFSGRGVNPGA